MPLGRAKHLEIQSALDHLGLGDLIEVHEERCDAAVARDQVPAVDRVAQYGPAKGLELSAALGDLSQQRGDLEVAVRAAEPACGDEAQHVVHPVECLQLAGDPFEPPQQRGAEHILDLEGQNEHVVAAEALHETVVEAPGGIVVR